jgi:type II secretory pathway component PulF
MPEFEFKAVDVQGKFITGVSSAQNTESLSRILQDQGLFLMETVELGGGLATRSQAAGALLARLQGSLPQPKVTVKDVAFFTAQLSIMVRSALPLLESLQILTEQAANPTFRALLVEVTRNVSEGMALSAAFARHPETFDQIYISLLSAGEAAGSLDTMLDRLTAHLDFSVRLKSKIQSALVYPVIVMMTAMAVIGFLIAFVLPTFAQVFVELNINLPWPTRVLIASGAFLRQWWYALLLGLVAAVWAFLRWARDPRNALTVDGTLLSLPLIGDLTRNIVLTRVLRTLGSLLESGVSILRSLDLAKTAADNRVFHDLLEKVAQDVKEGKILSKSLKQSPQIPKVVIGMIATGEKTGTLPEVIGRVAGFYEAETDTSIKNIFAAMEPLFIVVLGLMVGGIALSVLLPMFDMAGGIK